MQLKWKGNEGMSHSVIAKRLIFSGLFLRQTQREVCRKSVYPMFSNPPYMRQTSLII